MPVLAMKSAAECLWDEVSLGEVMIRLDPGEGRIHTTRTFQVWEGGGEYNVARGLRRCFGLRTALVSSFVDNVLMPPIGLLLGGINFSTWGIQLTDSVNWKVGAFIQTVIDFTIVAFALFMVIKAMNKLSAPAPPAPAPMVPDDVKLLTEIRDLLNK